MNKKKEIELEKLTYEVEKKQKMLNILESGNAKRRKNINDQRKERAVFDKIFKNIEFKIMHKEKEIISQIKDLKQDKIKLNKSKEDLENLEKGIGENHTEKLVKNIENIFQVHYLDYDGENDDHEFFEDLKSKNTNQLSDIKEDSEEDEAVLESNFNKRRRTNI